MSIIKDTWENCGQHLQWPHSEKYLHCYACRQLYELTDIGRVVRFHREWYHRDDKLYWKYDVIGNFDGVSEIVAQDVKS